MSAWILDVDVSSLENVGYLEQTTLMFFQDLPVALMQFCIV
jgi:hypothetical protein